jgi:hypothetical protein
MQKVIRQETENNPSDNRSFFLIKKKGDTNENKCEYTVDTFPTFERQERFNSIESYLILGNCLRGMLVMAEASNQVQQLGFGL